MMILYTQKNCPQCRMIHDLLSKTDLEYTECQDVEEMQKQGIRHTPSANVDGQILLGKELMNYIRGAVK